MILSILRQPRILLALLFCYWLALVIGTHLPDPQLPHVVDMQDKLIHAGAYGVLTILILLAWRSAAVTRHPWSYVVLVGCLAVHAAADELTQQFVAGRAADLLDWMADMAGVGLAVMAVPLVRRLGRGMWLPTSIRPVDVAG